MNKYKVKTGTWLRFWENKDWINEINLYSGFQWYFRCCLVDDDERQINGWKKFVSRFRGKLVKMTIDAVSKFDDYSISKDILKKKQQNII